MSINFFWMEKIETIHESLRSSDAEKRSKDMRVRSHQNDLKTYEWGLHKKRSKDMRMRLHKNGIKTHALLRVSDLQRFMTQLCRFALIYVHHQSIYFDFALKQRTHGSFRISFCMRNVSRSFKRVMFSWAWSALHVCYVVIRFRKHIGTTTDVFSVKDLFDLCDMIFKVKWDTIL